MPVTISLITNLFFFGFTLWLGTYLLARNSHKTTVHLTGWGVVFYAVALSLEIIWGQQPNALLVIPALFWIGAVLHLMPEETASRQPIIRVWILTAIPTLILSLLNAWFSLIAVIALFGCIVFIAARKPRTTFKNTFAILTVIGLFFSLSTGLLVLPLNWIPRTWVIPALGLDLFLLGIAIVIWDAFDEGESLRSHIIRSFVSSLYYAGSLAVLMVIAIAIDGEMSTGRLVALTGVIAFGILAQTLSTPLQTLLDQLTLPQEPALNEQRKMLRKTADELPRLSTLGPDHMDEAEFVRLTRRAISNLGDLPKLAASPLTNLPLIVSQGGNNPLDRAHALKAALIESILQLKPKTGDEFGSTDEWRYYNSLYFPYVMGLKPYARRTDKESLDEASRQALEWFQTTVPERTLHNWQSIAATLVATDLKNKM